MNTLNHTALETLVKMQIEAERFAHRRAGKPTAQKGGEGSDEEGSTTVEYAIGAVATAAFAGLLLAVLKSGGVKNMLNGIIQSALSM